MNEPGIGKIVSFSWQKTKDILFPFEFKRWLKILFIVWLAGQGAGGNFNAPNRFKPPQEQTQTQSAVQNAQSAQTLQTEQTAPAEQTAAQGNAAGVFARLPDPNLEARKVIEKLGPWLFVLIPALIVLSILFMWLSARFQFVFLDLIVRRDIRIGESFGTYKVQGNSLFLWSWGFLAVFLAGALFCFLPAILFRSSAWLFLCIPLFLIFLFAMVVLGVSVADFVTPAMYRDGTRTMKALSGFLNSRPAPGAIGIYLLVKIGLGLLAGLIALLIMFAAGLVFLIATIIATLLGAGVIAVLPFLKLPLIVIGVTVGIAALVILFGLATLPIPVFFRVFSVVYLARFIPEYNLLRVPLAGSDTAAG